MESSDKVKAVETLAGVTTNQTHSENFIESQKNKGKLLEYIRSNVTGNDHTVKTPFGEKPLLYSDWTATGKPVKFIEDYLATQVYPSYANTHSFQSRTARQTIENREEARHIVKSCTNSSADDACIFTGTGATGAVNMLVNLLRLKDIKRAIDRGQPPTNPSDINFCKQNRWASYECTLCHNMFKTEG